MVNYQTLLVDRPRAGITVATLNRPDRLNAMTFQMFDELARLAAEVGADERTRCWCSPAQAADSAPAWTSRMPRRCRR